MFLADLHVHSNFSDGRLTIPEVVDFYGKRGFGAIAITDHICERTSFLGFAASHLRYTLNPATFPLYIEILRSEKVRAWEQYRMVVIPGFELSKNSLSNHRSAHVLGIGISDYVSAEGDVADLLKSIRSQGGLTIGAHPVSTRKFEKQTYHLWSRRNELAPLVDAWEVASGTILFPEVMNSGLPMIASSDFHHEKQINAWKSVFHCERSEEAILDAVRTQHIGFHFYQEKSHLHDFVDTLASFCSLGTRSRSHFAREPSIA
ncbi:MAG: PHP domain-containing protein [Bdellovibrionota bacterium]